MEFLRIVMEYLPNDVPDTNSVLLSRCDATTDDGGGSMMFRTVCAGRLSMIGIRMSSKRES